MNESEREQRETQITELNAALRQKDEYVRLQQRIDALQAGLEALSQQVRDLQEAVADCPGRAAAKWRVTEEVMQQYLTPRREASRDQD